MTKLKILGIERLTIDLIVPRLSVAEQLEVLSALNLDSLPPSALFCDTQRWQSLQELGLEQTGILMPGGCIANSLIGIRLAPDHAKAYETLNISWIGPCATDRASQMALRSLIEGSIQISPIYIENGTTRTICIRNDPEEAHPDATILIKLGDWPRNDYYLSPTSDTLLAIGLDTIMERPQWLSRLFSNLQSPVALQLNHDLSPTMDKDWLEMLFHSEKLLLVCGKDTELKAIADLMGCSYVEWPSRFNCNVVSTFGAAGADVLTIEGSRLHQDAIRLDVFPNDTLGAGDIVFGVCLRSLAMNEPLSQSLGTAMHLASEALGWSGARPSRIRLVTNLLNQTPISGEVDKLSFITDEIAFGSGVSIITGGQTGIDELALKVSGQFGLPSHAILPANLLRENGRMEVSSWEIMGQPRFHELGTLGYRERTWATCYLSDATLLFDYLNSSGSRECAIACQHFGRPLYRIEENLNPEKMAIELAHSGIRILNIAGHRGSLLEPDMAAAAMNFLLRLLPTWAAAWKRRGDSGDASFLHACCDHLQPDVPIIAIPNSGKMKELIIKRLVGTRTLLSDTTGSLFFEVPELAVNLICGRPRDMASWLYQGVIAGALAGLDELLEGGFDGKILCDTGLFASSLVLLRRQGKSQNPGAIVTQMPRLTKKLLEYTQWRYNEIIEISGAAEAWLRLGLAEFCVDTWHTGKTARANGITPIAVIGETSLCLVSSKTTLPLDHLLRQLL